MRNPLKWFRAPEAQPVDVLEGLPRGNPTRSDRDAQTPAEVFAPPDLVAKRLRYQDGMMFLGVVGGRVMSYRDDNNIEKPFVQGGTPIGLHDDRHMMTVAGSRGNKGRSGIVTNLAMYPHSCLVVDPKGELATTTAAHRARKLKQKVYVLDPFHVATLPDDIPRARFNPMNGLVGDALIEGAARLADALVVTEGGRSDLFFEDSARAVIEGKILHVATDPMYKGRRNLGVVRDHLSRGLDQGLELEMRNNPGADGRVQRAADELYSKTEREASGVLSTAQRHVKFIDFPEIEEVLKGDGIQLSDLKTRATTIYLCLPACHMGTCNRWLRMIIGMALQEMERIPGKPATGGPVLFLMDEFATLGHMKSIEDAAGQIAGFGVKLWPVVQDLTQLKGLYRDRWETFLANAGVVQFYANNDLMTLDWISKRCGQTSVTVKRSNHTSVHTQITTGADGVTWHTEHHMLLTVAEAGRLFGRDELRQLVIRPGKSPMVLQAAFYDKHELFRGMF
jgi:type IV secretion system protein VirD4